MAIAYPVGLPTVLASKRVSKGAAFSIASPRRGTPYVEPTGTDTPTVFAVEWLLSEADAAALVEWVQTTLERGTLEFTIPLRTETGLREITGNFLPDGLLDRQRDGTLWRYSASIVSRTGTGPLIVPAPPPPAPAPAPVSGWFYSTHLRAVVFTAGEGGALVQTELAQACAEAVARKVPLMLPPWDVQFNSTIVADMIVGVPGKSRLVPSSTFTRTGFANQFMVINSAFSQGYDDATANEILYKDFDLPLTPSANGSVFGLGNVRKGLIERLNITANRAINGGTGKPYAIDSLIDLYTCVKRVEVRGCDLRNITGAYGVNKISEFGGSCMWIRNLSADGTDPDNVTEGNWVHHNTMVHMSSDEVIAIFGVRGVTRGNKIHHNRITGLASIDGVYHSTFIACFPLNDGSGAGLGATAAVYDNEIAFNDVEDGGCLYDVVRIGNGADASNPCYNNRSFGNRVRQIRSSNATTGPYAVWLAITGGTDPNKPDPEIASSIFRCIDGTFGLAYTRDTSGNSSTDDIAINDGATIGTGFQSFQQVTNPTSLGDLFSGVSNCRSVQGGKIECASYAFFNCRQVVGTNYRQNLVGGAVFYVNVGVAGVYSMSNTLGESFGKLVEVTAAAVSGTVVGAFNNVCQMTGGASGHPTLLHQTGSSGVLVARQNITRGANSAITSGSGTITRSLNDWNGTTD
jgi:hypothetical protein